MAAALCNGRDTLFFLLVIGKGNDGGNGNDGCNKDDDNDGEDDGDDGKLWQRSLLPPLFVHCQNFEKMLSNFWKNIIRAKFWRHISIYAQQNLFVFIAFLDRSHWAEKECHLSLLEWTKIDRAKNHESSTSFA
jgi:hypothetical protein